MRRRAIQPGVRGLSVLLEASVDVRCDADTAWAFVRDMENYVRWFPYIVQMDSADSLPPGTIGKRYRETAIVPGGREESISVIVIDADETQRRLAIEADLKPVLPRFDYRVIDLGDGTSRFEWRCAGRGTGPLAALGRRIMPVILKPRLARAMENFRRILGGGDDEVMRAAYFLRFGAAASAMRIDDRVARPVPGKGEVLVRQAASSINQIDGHRRNGYGRNAMRARGALRFPVVLGNDIAGVVERVGPGVKGFKAGDAVFGVKPPSSDGAFADCVRTKAKHLVAKPAAITFEQAAAMPYVFLTAWRALVHDGGLRPTAAKGKRVFVQGGAGGVGAMAVQIAKAWGAHVAASCMPVQTPILKELGVDEAFEVGGVDYGARLAGFDLALCAASHLEQERMLAILKPGGRYVTVIHPTLTLTDQVGLVKGFMAARKELKALNASLTPRRVSAYWTLFRPDPNALKAMAALAAAGKLKAPIDSVYPLDQIVAAQERAESGQSSGKVVVTFGSPT